MRPRHPPDALSAIGHLPVAATRISRFGSGVTYISCPSPRNTSTHGSGSCPSARRKCVQIATRLRLENTSSPARCLSFECTPSAATTRDARRGSPSATTPATRPFSHSSASHLRPRMRRDSLGFRRRAEKCFVQNFAALSPPESGISLHFRESSFRRPLSGVISNSEKRGPTHGLCQPQPLQHGNAARHQAFPAWFFFRKTSALEEFHR